MMLTTDVGRRVRALLTMTVVGFVATWAVAWICAITVTHPVSASPLDPELDYFEGVHSIDPQWYIMGWRGFGSLQLYSDDDVPWSIVEMIWIETTLPSWSRIFDPPPTASWSRIFDPPPIASWSRIFDPPPTAPGGLVEDARGWPLLALRAEVDSSRLGHRATAARGGILLEPAPLAGGSFRWLSPRTLPYTPIWTGLVTNTAFYTACVLLLYGSLLVFRRSYRLRRGLCPFCAYPCGPSSSCSECGRDPRGLG